MQVLPPPLLRPGLQPLLRVRGARGQHDGAPRRAVQRAQVERHHGGRAQRSHKEEQQPGQLRKRGRVGGSVSDSAPRDEMLTV